jgi:hypothetical protein
MFSNMDAYPLSIKATIDGSHFRTPYSQARLEGADDYVTNGRVLRFLFLVAQRVPTTLLWNDIIRTLLVRSAGELHIAV